MLATPLDWLADLLGTDRGLLVRTLAQLATILVVGWIANRLVRLVARRIELAVDDGNDATLSAEEKRGQTIAQLVRSVGRAVVVIGVTLSSLNLFVDIKPLLAGVGILSLAVSFGAQSLVKDFISGFFILFENQFVVGDVVQIGDKSGVVERMTLRVVMLRNLEGALHTIPNGSIASVTNMTRGWSRAVVDVSIGYQADVDRAILVVREELERLRSEPVWQGRFDGISEVVGVQSLGENGVMIRSLLRTNPGSQWEVAREFQRRIKRRLDDEGIEIPYPQRTVHVRHHQAPSDPTPGLDS